MDPDQLASEKPADQDLHCFQNRICIGSAWQGLMGTCMSASFLDYDPSCNKIFLTESVNR